MRLDRIYISAFGGLKDFNLELTDGLNVIYGNNEDGKSTVFAFIKAMFFGTGRNTKNLSDSARLKYTPWDGSVMAGRIYFVSGGKRYCLEKEFRKSDSTDRITLTDLDSGKVVETGENIGARFFGMSAAAFERSLFISGGDFIKDSAAAGEINGKLSNIAVTGTEDVSYKKIEKNIFDARAKIISKSGRSGSYNDDLQSLNDLNSRLDKADSDAKAMAHLNEAAIIKRNEYEQLSKKYTKLKILMDREQDFKNREKLTEFLETKRKLDELNKSLTLQDGTIINEAFAQKVEFCLNKYEKSSERCEQIKGDISRIRETIELQNNSSPENIKEQIEKSTEDVTYLQAQKTIVESNEPALSARIEELKQKLNLVQNKKAVFNIPLLIISVLLILTGPVLAILDQPMIFAGTLVILGACLAISSYILRPKNTSAITSVQNELAEANTTLAESKADKNRIQEQINNLNAQINNLSTVLNADAAVKEQRLADLAEKNEALNSEVVKADAAKVELLSLLSGFSNIDSVEKAKALLDEVKQKTVSQKEIKLQLKTASQFLGNIDYSEAEQKLAATQDATAFENVDFDVIKSELNAISERLSALKEKIIAIATELKTSFKHSENPEELKRQISELQERIDSKKDFCDTADLALAVLQESFYELRRGYGSELEKQTQEIFSSLTGGKYSNVNVSDELDMSVEQSGAFGTRELEYLSLGTTHQAYLSLRLAIAKLISNDDALPIFLDDSLSQYDDIRTENAIKFLKEFCTNSQGIFFTCHNSLCEIAQSQGIEVQKPYE